MKLGLQIGLLFLLAMAGFAVYEVYDREKNFSAMLEEKEAQTIQQLSLVLGKTVYHLDSVQTEISMRVYLEERDILALKVMSDDMPVLALAKDPESGEVLKLSESERQRPVFENSVVKTAVLLYDNQELGQVEAVFSRQLVKREIANAVSGVAKAAVIILALESLLMSRIVRRRITRPLLEIVYAAEQIAEGNVGFHLQHVRSQDEIGALNQAFIQMLDYLQRMAGVAEAVSQGDLRQTITPRSSHDVLGKGFQEMASYLNEMAGVAAALAEGDLRRTVTPKTEHDVLGSAFQQIEALRTTMSQVIQETERVQTSSDELTRVSAQMASGAEESSHKVVSVSSASEQISRHVNDIAEVTERFSANIAEISRNIGHVKEVTTHAVSLAQSSSSVMSRLDSHSEEIGAIVKLITHITQQTNLLSLNATIEAARAGDVGKGFAVVAGEVKELARQITESAEDITQRVDVIQSISKEASTAIEEISEVIDRINGISNAIAAGIDEQSATLEHIYQDLNSTALGSSEVAAAISDISSGAQDMSTSAVTVQQEAEALSRFSAELHNVMRQFKI